MDLSALSEERPQLAMCYRCLRTPVKDVSGLYTHLDPNGNSFRSIKGSNVICDGQTGIRSVCPSGK
jgi:hypothetical protein